MATDKPQRESVSLWHPWQEKEGCTHTLSLFREFNFSSVEEIISTISRGKYYALCTDILSSREVPDSLVRNKSCEPYLSRNGYVTALRIKGKKGSGFLIPGIQWGCSSHPTQETINNIQSIFSIFNREAVSPSSLSEKILRATLPDKLCISRPSVALRKSILDNRSQARILKQGVGVKSEEAFEYDKIKAYLAIAASGVPSPFSSPLRFFHSDAWQRFPLSWMRIKGVAHTKSQSIQPLLIKEGSICREAYDNEEFDTWVWTDKMHDCIAAGYTLEVIEGYAFAEKSTFMAQWADILFNACEKYKEDDFYPILKQMTQGLPGRFLKAPEVYTLVHLSEISSKELREKTVIPISPNWTEDESPQGNWFMRVDKESEQARETAQLTPIGDYIVSECERQIYLATLEEQRAGNRVIRIYIDSITTTEEAKSLSVGKKAGDFKVKKYFKAIVKENRFIGYLETGERVLKAPSFKMNSPERKRLETGEKEWVDSS